MIIYSSSIEKFKTDSKNISNILNDILCEKLFRKSGKSEIDSWNNSLEYFSEILKKSNIDQKCTVTLEYNIPFTQNRIDLIISGYKDNYEKILLFEIKQWSVVETIKESNYLVRTLLNGCIQEVLHPGYQLYSYSQILKNFNKYIQDNNVILNECVLMHNYSFTNNDDLLHCKYDDFNKNIIYFGKNDEKKLIEFLDNAFDSGDNGIIMNCIDSSKINPSTKLQNEICSLIKDNKFYNLIDDQVYIFDKILSTIFNSEDNVIIVSGGPGTGKSVIAVNLLSKINSLGLSCQYVSRNTAPRVVYSYKLKNEIKKTIIDYLFKSSGSYIKSEVNAINTLIVDEAHCLTEKSGLFNNMGDNQINEIIKSSRNSIFFIDEKQKVHLNDIGTINEIKYYAKKNGKKISTYSLNYQFRCNGSNEYLQFVDYILGNNLNNDASNINYEFNVVDSPQQLLNIIKEKNKKYNSRILAGYCWNWNKKEINNSDFHDIVIDDFSMSWNLGMGQTFAIDESINEAGCIHSVQGLEFDYVGVIIGKDLEFIDGKVCANFNNHGDADPSFKGIKKRIKENPLEAQKEIDELIKNAYRVLLTRGIKGCYVYCEDETYRKYLKKIVKNINFN